MQIEIVKVGDIKKYDLNARTHPKKQIELLAKNIKRFGFTTPLLIDKDNNLIAGHGRILAGDTLGMVEYPCVRLEHLTPEEVKALRLADNQVTALSDWDLDLVLPELKNLSIDLQELTGFDKELLIEPQEKDDEVPEVQEAKSVLGDLYELGKHRLLVGDCTIIDNVEKLMDGNKADMVFTDPPYNALKSWKKNIAKSETRLNPNKWFANDNMAWQEYDDFIAKTISLLSGHSYYICCDFRVYPIIRRHIEETDYKERHCIVWKKNVWGLGKRYRFQHEFILYATKDKAPFYGDRSQSDVWEIATDKTTDHNTPKPIELMVKGILNSSKVNDIVLDTFLGSGSTLIACEKTNRKCYGLELDPHYADVIVQRYVNYSGNTNIKLNGQEITWNKTED